MRLERQVPAARHVVTVLLALAASSAPAAAQTAAGPIVGGLVGAAVLDSSTHVAFAGAASYRFNAVFGLGVELTGMPMLTPDPPFSVAEWSSSYPFIEIDDREGSATIFTTNVRLEMPTTARRVTPYAVAGGGVAQLEESFVVRYRFVQPLLLSPDLVAPGAIPPFPIREPFPQPVSSSTLAMALTLGGGVSVLATDRLSIDADLRYFGFLGTPDRNVGRFGVGASYRF